MLVLEMQQEIFDSAYTACGQNVQFYFRNILFHFILQMMYKAVTLQIQFWNYSGRSSFILLRKLILNEIYLFLLFPDLETPEIQRFNASGYQKIDGPVLDPTIYSWSRLRYLSDRKPIPSRPHEKELRTVPRKIWVTWKPLQKPKEKQQKRFRIHRMQRKKAITDVKTGFYSHLNKLIAKFFRINLCQSIHFFKLVQLAAWPEPVNPASVLYFNLTANVGAGI